MQRAGCVGWFAHRRRFLALESPYGDDAGTDGHTSQHRAFRPHRDGAQCSGPDTALARTATAPAADAPGLYTNWATRRGVQGVNRGSQGKHAWKVLPGVNPKATPPALRRYSVVSVLSGRHDGSKFCATTVTCTV